MGILSTLGGLLTPNTANTVVKDSMKMIDNAFYTEQEKAEQRAEVTKWGLEQTKSAWADNNTTRSITRRWLAVGLFVLYALITIPFFVALVFTDWLTPEKMQVGQTIISVLTVKVGAVYSFYFGNHIAQNINKMKKK